MSSNQTDDVVKEYLDHVERLIGDLPLIQRRELLVDLETHISTARAEGEAGSEGELLAILERLGSPEVVAAAAHEESLGAGQLGAGQLGAGRPAPLRPRIGTPVVIGAVALLILLAVFVLGTSLVGVESTSAPVPVPTPVGTPH